MKKWVIYLMVIGSLVGCGNKIEEEVSSGNDITAQNKKDGFVDYNDIFHSFKEVKQAKKEYLKQIKNGEFIEAITTEEWLWEYRDRNGLTQEEANIYRNNHNALLLLSEIDDRLKLAEKKKEMYYEVEILPKLNELKAMPIATKEIVNQIKKYEKKTEELFNTISKDLGEKRHSEKNNPKMDGNEDYDNDGNYIQGGEDVSQWKSVDSVKSSDDVYGNE
ncbi:hypothetical protein M2901_05450 [Vagococcus lutrae]|uniref:hypothetical protein n=1 Tax=Vagococcus lutrae TaxID=81947 RepID=UPI00200F52A1|nr:hypothetical protein [Vagococcus lutrae]UQF70235.1 hypothetical protein M2901_05450 [Vagococcus lutrae]